ncbi:hypothetical protein Tcan_03666 [Toxocara canis]|uniref:Uncharacterized protein n=1 Tax=Toxocara canis TaxID=6265 RepID=A0A0B2V3J5_TOXCA|nr:hypothetical protein Tcan_03666 [Toxocara canis]
MKTSLCSQHDYACYAAPQFLQRNGALQSRSFKKAWELGHQETVKYHTKCYDSSEITTIARIETLMGISELININENATSGTLKREGE